jgi:hypothetical protein
VSAESANKKTRPEALAPARDVTGALSGDMELRPPGAAPGGLHRSLGAQLSTYIEWLHEQLSGLQRLARQAYEARDTVAEAALRAKLAELLVKVARVAQDAAGAPREIRTQEDLPRWDDLQPEVQRELERWLDRAERQGPPQRELP